MATEIATLQDLQAIKDEILRAIESSKNIPDKEPQQWGGMKEVRQVLGGLGEQKVNTLRKMNLLKCVQFGGTYRYDLEHAVMMMENHPEKLNVKVGQTNVSEDK